MATSFSWAHLATEPFASASKDPDIRARSQAIMQSSQPEVLLLLVMTSGMYLNILQYTKCDFVCACVSVCVCVWY